MINCGWCGSLEHYGGDCTASKGANKRNIMLNDHMKKLEAEPSPSKRLEYRAAYRKEYNELNGIRDDN